MSEIQGGAKRGNLISLLIFCEEIFRIWNLIESLNLASVDSSVGQIKSAHEGQFGLFFIRKQTSFHKKTGGLFSIRKQTNS